MTADARLASAVRSAAGAIGRRWDTRALIAVLLTAALIALTAAQVPMSEALWAGWGTIIGHYFPRNQTAQETSR